MTTRSGARNKTALAVYLKAPQPGRVKTRLARDSGRSAATELYRAFVRDTLAWVGGCKVDTLRAEFSPPEQRPLCASLLPRKMLSRFALCPQADGDLGARMAATFASMFASGCERAVIIGTDCPLLGQQEIISAFKALKTCDLVLGPSGDGGYYLIGLSRPAPEIFRNIPWSTPRVLECTLRRAATRHLKHLLLHKLDDVDRITDVPQLWAQLVAAWRAGSNAFPVHTFRALSWHFAPYRKVAAAQKPAAQKPRPQGNRRIP